MNACTLTIRIIQIESESGNRKLKFDWLDLINTYSKFWVLMGSKVIFRYVWAIKFKKLCP